ncbi:ribonuclease HII [Salipiger sp. IMCC34102]|uniref:ribonuclease HII n=1 Tax=Salipiger sp. IMCC34102 TaxID=2510647 RepID=UPI00101D655C|nr:ribonuclease HII [Salipiger sp. IMCC34102]RYH04010.1 ribonuclease HII [Salipiger sp. IMCC34102]
MTRPIPDDTLERATRAKGFARVAGVDEVGRGPLAGPVCAAAVILDPANIPPGLADSKTLSRKRREALAELIPQVATVGYGIASVEEIDHHNILRASHIAMVRALEDLAPGPDFALVDGNMMPRGLPCPAMALVKGDSRSVSIAAASIVAKVWRDELMVGLAQQHPEYGWGKNAGYPTPEHKAALKCHGVTLHHRRSFAPIHNILWQEKNG